MIFRLILFVEVLILSSCNSSSKLNKEWNCDYGTTSIKTIQYYYEGALRFFNLKAGDVVANIGSSNGHKELCWLAMKDSITFYAEDIDSSCLNRKELDKGISYFSGLIRRPIKSKIEIVIGTDKATALPDNFFDKIIIYLSYHHLKYNHELLQDINSKLKADGRLLVFEKLSKKAGDKCEDGITLLKSKEQIIEEITNEGYMLCSVVSGLTLFEFSVKK